MKLKNYKAGKAGKARKARKAWKAKINPKESNNSQKNKIVPNWQIAKQQQQEENTEM